MFDHFRFGPVRTPSALVLFFAHIIFSPLMYKAITGVIEFQGTWFEGLLLLFLLVTQPFTPTSVNFFDFSCCPSHLHYS